MKKLLPFLLFFCPAFLFSQSYGAEKAMLLHAEITTNPSKVILKWAAPEVPATSYIIWRKSVDSTNWGNPIATLQDTSLRSYTDLNVSAGGLYEYRLRKAGPTNAWGYVNAGVEHRVISKPNTILLVIDSNYILPLYNELERLREDLEKEGWKTVIRYVSHLSTPPQVKSMIQAAVNTEPSITTLLLIGHVPVPYSGNIFPDGHSDHAGAWPADGYYADLDGTWTDISVNNTSGSRPENQNIPGDGKFDQGTYPSDLELEVGRIDMVNMTAFGLSDIQLLKRYLDKNHQFRTGVLVPKQQGLVSDNFPGYAEGFSASARSAFSAFFTGSGWSETAYHSSMSSDSYIWSYGCGGGSYTSCGGIGTTNDFVNDSLQNVFTLLFGSYFGDWDVQNSYLRAPLASRGWTLTNFWSGRPYFYAHPMAAGKHIGYAAKMTMNNASIYSSSTAVRGVHQGLMGDPSLTMFPFVSNFSATKNLQCNHATLAFSSTDTLLDGYHIYRKSHPDSHWVFIQPVIGINTTVIDSNLSAGMNYYLWKPVKKILNGSGVFYIEGRGILDSLQAPAPIEITQVVVNPETSGCDGNITLTVTSPGILSYSWNPPVSTTNTAQNLCPGTYTVSIIDASTGCSTVLNYTVSSTVGIPTENLSLQLFPNPSSGIFQLVAQEGYFPYEIKNQLGQHIKDGICTHATLFDLSAEPAGVYYLRIGGEHPQTLRMIKN